MCTGPPTGFRSTSSATLFYAGPQASEEVVFRVLLFKFFNRVETWELLCERLGGMPSWEGYRFAAYDRAR